MPSPRHAIVTPGGYYLTTPGNHHREESGMSSSLSIQTGREVENLRLLALRMGGLAEATLDTSLRALWTRSTDLAREIAPHDDAIDQIDLEIDGAVLQVLALRSPVAGDLRQTLVIKTMAADLERIGDLARSIGGCVTRLAEAPPIPSPALLRELADASRRALSLVLQAFADHDVALARTLLLETDRIAELESRVVRDAIGRMRRSPSVSAQELDLILIARSLERAADHALHIADTMVRSRQDPPSNPMEPIGR